MNVYISTFILLYGHFLPAYKTIEVVDEKNSKTNYDGNIRNIAQRSKNPKDNQDDIVCRIGYCIPRTATEGEINRHKACCDRERTRQQVCGVEMPENEIEYNGHGGGENEHKDGFFFADMIDFYLCFVAFIGVSEPRYEGKNSHRHCHTKICYHFAVITE